MASHRWFHGVEGQVRDYRWAQVIFTMQNDIEAAFVDL